MKAIAIFILFSILFCVVNTHADTETKYLVTIDSVFGQTVFSCEYASYDPDKKILSIRITRQDTLKLIGNLSIKCLRIENDTLHIELDTDFEYTIKINKI